MSHWCAPHRATQPPTTRTRPVRSAMARPWARAMGMSAAACQVSVAGSYTPAFVVGHDGLKEYQVQPLASTPFPDGSSVTAGRSARQGVMEVHSSVAGAYVQPKQFDGPEGEQVRTSNRPSGSVVRDVSSRASKI